MAAVFVQNLFTFSHHSSYLVLVYCINCISFTCFFFDLPDRVLFSAVGSACLRHCDPLPDLRPWRLRIGSRSLARKSQPHSPIDLSRELPDVNLHIMAKDTYLNFGALCIKPPSLRLLHGDTPACNTHRRVSHPCSHLRPRHRTTCLFRTLFHHHLPCFHHHHHHLCFNRNLACRQQHRSPQVHHRPNRPDHKSRRGINSVPLRSLQLRNGRLMWIIMTPPKLGALTCR